MTFLFDLDGTLCNTEEGVVKSAIYALEAMGLPVPDRKILRGFIGPPLKQSFSGPCGLSDALAETAVVKFRERYNRVGKLECSLYPGMDALLRSLKSTRLCVATSKLEAPAREILEKEGVADLFQIIRGATLDGSLAEKSDIIAAVLQALPKGEKVLMVGDTTFDIIGARKTGISVVAVGYGFGKTEELQSADYYCATVAELGVLLRELAQEG